MLLFQVSYDRFKEEIMHEKMQPGDRNQLECDDMGNTVAYYLTSLDRKLAFVYVVSKAEITPVQTLYLAPLSKLSKRITESNFNQLLSIGRTLERIELSLQQKPLQEKVIETVVIPSEP